VHHAVDTGQNLDECAEVSNPHALAGVDLTNFCGFGHCQDAIAGFFEPDTIHGGNVNRAVVVDVDLGVGLFLEGANVLATGADDCADLVDRDFHRLDPWHVRLQARARLGDRRQHLFEDVEPRRLGTIQRFRHDRRSNATDFDVHLQGGDAIAGTRHFEVHVTKVIFGSEDVSQDDVFVAFHYQTHCHTGYRRRNRHAAVHQCQG